MEMCLYFKNCNVVHLDVMHFFKLHNHFKKRKNYRFLKLARQRDPQGKKKLTNTELPNPLLELIYTAQPPTFPDRKLAQVLLSKICIGFSYFCNKA